MGPQYVAFDLETTGLDPSRDAIIEIGAVRFTREGVLEGFETLVNPHRAVSPAVIDLTGIAESDLAAAPPLEAVAQDFERFIAGAVLVGHNICNFDARVLDAVGIGHTNQLYDTQALATVLAPSAGQYGLANLASYFEIDFPVHHRALADAEAARQLFLALMGRGEGLEPNILGQVAQWLAPTAWPWRRFFGEMWEASLAGGIARKPVSRQPSANSARPLRPRPDPVAVPAGEPLGVLDSASHRPDVFPEFDDRPEQRRMLEAVADAFGRGTRLMVEAGTGTGKSMAYLIPAACQALVNSSRVVVSTSTINLQEQLTGKDIPALQALMPPESRIEACQLKGRRNYLCMRKFAALRATALSDEEAMLASRVLVWLSETVTGDRAELRLSPAEEAVWARISADGADCTNDNSPFVVDGSCFMQRARKRAEASHIVVVNHALLLSDIGTGGRVIPPYEHLVIDEAHHLEDEATRQFGFSCGERELEGLLDRCDALTPALQSALRTSPALLQARQELAALASAAREGVRAAKPRVRQLCDVLGAFLAEQASPGEEQKLSITRSMRVQPAWSGVEIAWANCRLALGALAEQLQRIVEDLAKAEELGMLNHELILSDAAGCLTDVGRYAAGLAGGLEAEDPDRVVWLELERQGEGVAVCWVPLVVSGLLQEGLYSGRRTVVLTGATLRSAGGFAYLQERLGLEDCETLGLGSPFDFRRAALVVVPRDMPEPASPAYMEAVSGAIVDLARAAGGRTLVLFTAHSMLRAAHHLVSGPLGEYGVRALAQGVDGSPKQLVAALRTKPESVILGTSSFWEGVDIPGDTLSLIVMARLPFAVPTDPVVAARSALYEDAFNQYSLPQAVIRFKQGFGRLIRSRTDRGVLVVLDQRIVARQYGPAFLQALPGCGVRPALVREMPGLVEDWLRTPAAVATG